MSGARTDRDEPHREKHQQRPPRRPSRSAATRPRPPPKRMRARRPVGAAARSRPTSAATTVIRRMSRLRMWLISCATTPCSSSRLRRRAGRPSTAIDACAGSAAGRERVRIRSGMTYARGRRDAGRDGHLLDDVLELAVAQPVVFGGRLADAILDGLRVGRAEHGAVAVLSCSTTPAAADRRARRSCAIGTYTCASPTTKMSKPRPRTSEERDEHRHHQPRAPAIRRPAAREGSRPDLRLAHATSRRSGTWRSAASGDLEELGRREAEHGRKHVRRERLRAMLNFVAMSL